jgi:hypothetical protein
MIRPGDEDNLRQTSPGEASQPFPHLDKADPPETILEAATAIRLLCSCRELLNDKLKGRRPVNLADMMILRDEISLYLAKGRRINLLAHYASVRLSAEDVVRTGGSKASLDALARSLDGERGPGYELINLCWRVQTLLSVALKIDGPFDTVAVLKRVLDERKGVDGGQGGPQFGRATERKPDPSGGSEGRDPD